MRWPTPANLDPDVVTTAGGDDGGSDGSTDTVLCVNNLSRFPQPVELDLRRWEGCHPVELLGTVPFPEIGELPYLLTFAPHGFYWFLLTDGAQADV